MSFTIYRLCRNNRTMERLGREQKKYLLPNTKYFTGMDMYSFINEVISSCPNDYALLCHDDVILPKSIESNVIECINSADDAFGSNDWGVIGNAGLQILSKETITYIADPHTQILPPASEVPMLVESIDGNTMLLNIRNLRNRNVLLPTSLVGFHLYDVILSLETYKQGLVCAISSWLYVMHKSPGNYKAFLKAIKQKQFQRYFSNSFSNHIIKTINDVIPVKRNYKHLFKTNTSLQSLETTVNNTILKVLGNRKFVLNIIVRLHIKSFKIFRLLDSINTLKRNLNKNIELQIYLVINKIPRIEIDSFVQQLQNEYPKLNFIINYSSDSKNQYPRVSAIKKVVNNINDDDSYSWIIDYDDFVMPEIAQYLQIILSNNNVIIGDSYVFKETWIEDLTFPIISSLSNKVEAKDSKKIFSGNNFVPICSVIYKTKILKTIFNNNKLEGDYFEDYALILLASKYSPFQKFPIPFAGISFHGDNTVLEKDRTHWDYSYVTFLAEIVNNKLLSDHFRNFQYEMCSPEYIEFQGFKQGLFWAVLQRYRIIKKKTKFLLRIVFSFINTYIVKIFNSIIPKPIRFPILLLIPLIFFCLFGLHGASIGTYSEAINGDAGSNLIFGHNRWIRSDEYLATTPILLSQEIGKTPKINYDIGTGIDLTIQANMPTGSIFSIFKPPSWLFYITNNLDIAFSFFWWFRAYLLIIGTYFLLLELTKHNYSIAIFGSIAFFFTPFIQWWTNFDLIAYSSIIVASLLRIIKTKKKFEIFLMSLIFYFFSICFALILYPPFQVTIVWSSIFIVIGYLLNNYKKIPQSGLIKLKIILVTSSILLIFGTIALFFLDQKEAIQIIKNTSYPGERFYPGGGISIKHLFNGLYNILLQSDSNGVPQGQRNQSEASSFFLLFIPILISYLFILFKDLRKGLKANYIIILLSGWTIFLSALALFPFPTWILQSTFLYMVSPFRLIIGLGFSSYILTFYFLSLKKEKSSRNSILSILISASFGLFTYFLGTSFYSETPIFFGNPSFLSPSFKIILISCFSFSISYLLLKGHRKLFLLSFVLFSIASTALINPLYKGTDSLNQTTFAESINKYHSSPDNKWVVYGDHRFAQYILANGQTVLNGIHYYPLSDMWHIIDPAQNYIDIYNRYAHIHFSDNEEKGDLVELIYADQINVNIDPCDIKLKILNVSYFLLTEKKDYSCLDYNETLNTFLRGELYIYSRK